jgi:hypothetical protein
LSGQPENAATPLTTEHSDISSGKNLSFDFADEEPATDLSRFARRGRRQTQARAHQSRQWEVGEDDAISTAPRAANYARLEEEPPLPEQLADDDLEPEFLDNTRFVDEDKAPVYNRARTHSAGFLVLVIFLIAAAFAALTLVIHNVPANSSVALSYLPVIGDRFVTPATPAKLVALGEVTASYQAGKQGEKALVISGSAENVGNSSLRVVQLTARLRDGERRLMATQAVYCGNSVSAGMISQMTAHEIEFFQKLEPAKSFILEPSASCRFVAVFLNPPAAAHAYDVSVSEAIPEAPSSEPEPAS